MAENTSTQEEVKDVHLSDTDDIQKILASGQFTQIPKVGDLVTATVIAATKSEVKLDIHGLTTGVVRGREFFDESNEYSSLKVGDDVEATVIELENENGEMELSFRHAGHQKAWDNLDELLKDKKIIDATVTDANKGGLMIKVGQIMGFLPVSQLSPKFYPRVPGGDKNKILDRLKSYIGKSFKAKIIDVDEADNKLIVSEKAAWEEEQKEVLSQFKVGDAVEGKVTAVTDFGVFVEFGPQLEGLIHISELAWQRIDNPEDIVKVGEKIKAEIISIEGSKIFLSSKKLIKDPWHNINEKYNVGQIVKGKVLKVNPFGLFVELDPEIHGLAHISELSNKPIDNITSISKPGSEMEFKIISIEPKDHRLGLTLRLDKDVPAPKNKETKPEETGAENVNDETETKKEDK